LDLFENSFFSNDQKQGGLPYDIRHKQSTHDVVSLFSILAKGVGQCHLLFPECFKTDFLDLGYTESASPLFINLAIIDNGLFRLALL